jgi:hypothetical protein
VLKAHTSDCSSIVCKENKLISFGKDFKLCIHSCDGKGTYEFEKQIQIETHYLASAIDFMNGKVLIGHDNGRIATVMLDSEEQTIHNYSHHDGECWGLEIIPETGCLLTSGDDNQFMEFDIKSRKLVRSGYVWLPEYNNGKPYELTKIRSTASTLCSYPAH